MRIYDDINPEQYDTRYERIPREGYMHSHWYPLIASAISKYCKDKMVLDVGCGTGAYTRLIAESTDHVLGLDISRVMLNYAKSKHPDSDLALADAHHIPLATESTDIVVCIGLFEYIERATVLEEINRVLKPDSIAIIMCPSKYSTARMTAKIICKVLGREYFCREPSYGEMLRLFKQSGLRVIEFGMDDGLIWLPDFMDRVCGRKIYSLIEKFFRISRRNPFSNLMLFIARKGE